MVLEGHLFLASLSDVHRRCCTFKLQESGGSHTELEVLVRRHSAYTDLSGGC